VPVDSRGNIHRVSAPNRRVSAPRLGPSRLVSRRTTAAADPAHRRHLTPTASDVAALVAGTPVTVGDAGSSGLHAVELAGLLHELSSRLLSADHLGQALDRLAAFVATALPGTARCSVVLIGEGGPLTPATHGTAGQSFDTMQYANGAGPGLEAARTRSVVSVPDLANDGRWPELADCARADGLGSVAALPLDVRRTAVGALSVYSARAEGIDPDLLLTAMALANQAEVLLGELSRREALSEGSVVDRAAGVIIAQRGCGAQEAYTVLQQTAQRLGLDRRTVAERLIAAVARNAG
jgi:ANTAR domain-containing protein/GAF domain-containing protein